jgi:cell division protein FtsW (lipid II flippase)
MDRGLKIVASSYGRALLLLVVVIMFFTLNYSWKKKKKYLKLIIPVVFISLLLLLSYKIVSKSTKKEVAANIKPFWFYLSEFKGDPSNKKI